MFVAEIRSLGMGTGQYVRGNCSRVFLRLKCLENRLFVHVKIVQSTHENQNSKFQIQILLITMLKRLSSNEEMPIFTAFHGIGVLMRLNNLRTNVLKP